MKPTRSILKYTLAVGLLLPFTASATIGYFAHGYGTKNKGMGGAGVASAQDSMSAALNPASMVFVGERAELGIGLFSPSPRSYNASGGVAPPDGFVCGFACPFTVGGVDGQEIESENDFFLVPHVAYNWMLGNDASYGITVYGNGGMNTRYIGGDAQHADGPPSGTTATVTTPGTYGAGTAGVNLSQLFINLSYAKKYSPKHAWGAGLIVAYQQFEADGVATFAGFSTDPSNLSNNGRDTSTGAGVKLGLHGALSDKATYGFSYQSKVFMSEFDSYAGLFAEQGDFDIPATVAFGFAYRHTPDSMFVFDIQRIYYSQVAAIANPISNLTLGCGTGDTTQCLGGSNGAGFGWTDVTAIKFGYETVTHDKTRCRWGISYNNQPIPESEVVFNILAPAVNQVHLTYGFTKDLGNNREISFGAMYAPENTVTGTNAFNPNQTIALEMKQFELEMSYGWKF